jgi:hypothetical protein
VGSRLGSLFLTAALGPLQYAGQCIMARRIDDGLRQLSGQDVLAAYERGIASVAQEVGVSPATVASLLPLADMTALAARIAHNQQHAIEQWHLHAGDTGLLDGVADLTVDGRAPDASLCLLRLSAKMKLDKQLATPLRELSDDLDRWQQLLEASRTFIEDGEVLKRAHRQRRLIRFGLVLAGGLAAAAVIVWVTRVQLARGRVDDALAASDPCRVAVEPSDRAKASSAQEAAIREREKACETVREDERRRSEEERKKREAEQRAAEARAAEEARCEGIARAALNDGPADGLDDTTAALVGRMASRSLLPADLEIGTGALPCHETNAFTGLAGAYAVAALDSLAGWMMASTPSEAAVAILKRGKEAIGPEARINFGHHVERYAEKALLSGNHETVARARALCRAAQAVDQPPRQFCRGVLEVGGG